MYNVEKEYLNYFVECDTLRKYFRKDLFFYLLHGQYCLSHLYLIIGNNEYMSILKEAYIH